MSKMWVFAVPVVLLVAGAAAVAGLSSRGDAASVAPGAPAAPQCAGADKWGGVGGGEVMSSGAAACPVSATAPAAAAKAACPVSASTSQCDEMADHCSKPSSDACEMSDECEDGGDCEMDPECSSCPDGKKGACTPKPAPADNP